MNRITLTYKDWAKLILSGDYESLLAWIDSNVTDANYVIEKQATISEWRVIEFTHEEDFLAFKLRFGL